MLPDHREVRRPLASVVLLVVVAACAGVPVASAQVACGSGGVTLNLEQQLNVRIGGYTGVGNVCDLGAGGFTTTLRGEATRPPDSVTNQSSRPDAPHGGWVPNADANPLDLIRLFCRRDDYAFLPQGANGGLPCTSTTSGAAIDPGEVARELFGRLSLPSLRLDMNPRLGLVAVPTWFWVEGY